MTQLISRDGLGDLTKLGQGGQGIVYQAPKVRAKFANRMVFKEYKPQARGEVDFEALSAMPALVEESLSPQDGQGLVSIAAWPCAVVESDTRPVGFVMPAIPDSFFIELTTVKGRSKSISEFQHLLNPAPVLSARGIAVTDQQRYQLVRELAKSLSFLHRIGVSVGDISPKNVLFSLKPRPAVYFVDCDTMRVNGVSALPQRETPEWQVPPGEELATIYSDTYKLGLLALRLLVGDQHTKNPQDLPRTTPKLLRQLITDTLTKQPADRPLPEVWTYLLGQIIDTGQQKPTDPLTAVAPTYTSEPTPIVRSRMSIGGEPIQPVVGKKAKKKKAKGQSTPAPSPAPSVTGVAMTRDQKIAGAAALLLLPIIFTVFVLANQGGNGNSSSSATRTPPPTSTSTSSAPQLSGGYIETRRNSGSDVYFTNNWYFTPCGEGCAQAGANRATLVDGQWTMDTIANIVCNDDSIVEAAARTRLIWDPYTLAGEAQSTQILSACGYGPGSNATFAIQLRKSGS